MLPQPNITQVGEHLLSLVQELEAFASSNALPDLLLLKGDAVNLPAQSAGWAMVKGLLDGKEDSLEALCKRSSCASLIPVVEGAVFGSPLTSITPADCGVNSAANAYSDPLDGEADTDGGRGTSHLVLSFVNEWLTALADATVGLLAGHLASIPVLTPRGCAQLLTDVEYLSNVINAMGIRPHVLLLHIYQILSQKPDNLLRALDIPQVKARHDFNALLKFDQILFKSMCRGAKKL